MVGADAAAAQPAGHGAVGPYEAGVADGVDVDLAYVHDQHPARLCALDEDAATGRVAAYQLSLQRLLIGMSLEPRPPVDLSLDLELLAG